MARRVNHLWTEADHEKLIALSERLLPTKEIAALMGCSVGMVYKKRGELGIRPARCQHCRGPLPSEIKNGRPLSYCSMSCRADNLWAYEHNAIRDSRPKVCEQCHGPLDLSRKVVRFCSPRCSSRAWWERAQQDPAIIATRRERTRKYNATRRAQQVSAQEDR